MHDSYLYLTAGAAWSREAAICKLLSSYNLQCRKSPEFLLGASCFRMPRPKLAGKRRMLLSVQYLQGPKAPVSAPRHGVQTTQVLPSRPKLAEDTAHDLCSCSQTVQVTELRCQAAQRPTGHVPWALQKRAP